MPALLGSGLCYRQRTRLADALDKRLCAGVGYRSAAAVTWVEVHECPVPWWPALEALVQGAGTTAQVRWMGIRTWPMWNWIGGEKPVLAVGICPAQLSPAK